jgi:hypothetical protein
MALSLGWPKNELLRHLQFGHNLERVGAAELYSKYAVTSASQLPRIIEADLDWARRNEYQVMMITKPLLARLRFDPEVAAQIFEHLKASTNPTVKASFPRLLGAIGEVTPERADWCVQELGRQKLLKCPEIGYDALARTARSVTLCVLESLGGAGSADGRLSLQA